MVRKFLATALPWMQLLFMGCVLERPLLESAPPLDSPTELEGPFPKIVVLEAFGSFDCGACPEAEAKLDAILETHGTDRLALLNYHVSFTQNDPDEYITPETEAIKQDYNYTSLPQLRVDGDNSQFRDASGKRFSNRLLPPFNEYSEVIKAALKDETSPLHIGIENIQTGYQSDSTPWVQYRVVVAYTGEEPLQGLELQANVVKNEQLEFANAVRPWTTVVLGVKNKDVKGDLLRIPSLNPGREIGFTVRFDQLPPEPPFRFVSSLDKYVHRTQGVYTSPPDSVKNYALIAFVKDNSGEVLQGGTARYNPELGE